MSLPQSQVDFYVDLCERVMMGSVPLTQYQLKHLRLDLRTLRRRIQTEGLSFVTKTMPKLGKALDQALVSRRLEVPREFKRSHGNRNIPAFLQEYFSRCFDSSGCLLDTAPAEVIKHLRQVLYYAYRLELDYKDSQNESVIADFVSTESELQGLCLSEDTQQIVSVAAQLVERIFDGFDPKDIVPRHGPGSVATGEKHEKKWNLLRRRRFFVNLHREYPREVYFDVGGSRECMDQLASREGPPVSFIDDGCAKVVLVPKDSRGPRLISCEPLEYQWIQQGLGRKIMSHLEGQRLTRGQVNFTHQGINRDLALSGSKTGEWSTIDLKDASDRVSLPLVRSLFIRTPNLLRCLEASRSTATKLPNGTIITLHKFAPMGSALCFPVEALAFWVVIVAAVARTLGLTAEYVGSRVFVYGDDIIIPTSWKHVVIGTLEKVGLRVNRNKCCTSGVFRESCGMDAYKGVDVTPTKIRKKWSCRKSDATAYSAWASYANSFAKKGYARAASFIWDALEATHGKVPYGTAKSAFPCREVESALEAELLNKQLGVRSRFNRSLQRLEFAVRMVIPFKRKTKLECWPRLLRNMVLEKQEEPQTYVVPRSTQIHRGWAAIF